VRFTDERKYFVSEASVYRLLKAHDLITSPAYVVIKAANEFRDKTTAVMPKHHAPATAQGFGRMDRCAEAGFSSSPGNSAPLDKDGIIHLG